MKDSIPDFPVHENASRQALFKKKAPPLRFQKKPQMADAGNEIWFLTLSDLLMLLMIFFVLLFGMTLYQKNQTEAAQYQPAKTVTPETAAAEPTPSPKEATASLESDLLSLLGGDQGRQGVTVERRSGHLVMTFPERIMFDSGQAQIKSPVQLLLEKVAVFILDHTDLTVEVHGHTDDRPISNERYPSNWELSADRATQVARTLVRLGVHPKKVSIRGFGENHPLYPNDSDFNRLQNRRVEIQFSLLPSNS